MPFQQNRDIFYLCGIDQEESILLLFPDAKNPNHREVLFVKKTNNYIAVWEGAKLSRKEATNISGIKTVLWTDDFKLLFNQLTKEAKLSTLILTSIIALMLKPKLERIVLLSGQRKNIQPTNMKKSNFILQRLRSIKNKEEIDQIQQAINITEKGFRRVLNFVKPGVWEYEIEAEFANEFIKNRSKGFAYSPIIASGQNSTIFYTISKTILNAIQGI